MEIGQIKCEQCKKIKNRENEMFPLELILPIFNKEGKQFIVMKKVCFCELANSLKNIIKE